MISNARITTVCMYYKEKRGQMMNKKLGASKIYLEEDKYHRVMIPLMVKCSHAYYAFFAYWASREYRDISTLKRKNRAGGGDILHHYGGDGHLRLSKRMAIESGEEPSFVDAYIRGHRGTNEKYAQEMVQHHGDDRNWIKEDVDDVALYESSGGKCHRRYSMFNGIMDTGVVHSKSRSTKSGQSSSRRTLDESRMKQMDEEQAAFRDHMKPQEDHMREEEDRIRRQEECMKAQNEYFSNMAAWHQAMEASCHIYRCLQNYHFLHLYRCLHCLFTLEHRDCCQDHKICRILLLQMFTQCLQEDRMEETTPSISSLLPVVAASAMECSYALLRGWES